eukprot:TRINITY_DN55575_c0_g1_i1.p1 TRINITY_DN55575_c0_g1~~TRINITY_DN55575_c0_g1_i1.p1  ORF type:complete len:912 (+),score=211.40 TRINITY_DN55575_c0_g1_i1:137-2872(+)
MVPPQRLPRPRRAPSSGRGRQHGSVPRAAAVSSALLLLSRLDVTQAAVPMTLWATYPLDSPVSGEAAALAGRYEVSSATANGQSIWVQHSGRFRIYSSPATGPGGSRWMIGTVASQGTAEGRAAALPPHGGAPPGASTPWNVQSGTTDIPYPGPGWPASGSSALAVQPAAPLWEQPPDSLWVSLRVLRIKQPHRTGRFDRAHELYNGMPVWQQTGGGDQLIYASSVGVWAISSAAERTLGVAGLLGANHLGHIMPNSTRDAEWRHPADNVEGGNAPVVGGNWAAEGEGVHVSNLPLWRIPVPASLWVTSGVESQNGHLVGEYVLLSQSGANGMPQWQAKARNKFGGLPRISGGRNGRWVIDVPGVIDRCESMMAHYGVMLPDEPAGFQQTWVCFRNNGTLMNKAALIEVSAVPPAATTPEPTKPADPVYMTTPSPQATPQPGAATPTPGGYSIQQVLGGAQTGASALQGQQVSGRRIISVTLAVLPDGSIGVTIVLSGGLTGFDEEARSHFGVVAADAFGVGVNQLVDLTFGEAAGNIRVSFKLIPGEVLATPAPTAAPVGVFAAAVAVKGDGDVHWFYGLLAGVCGLGILITVVAYVTGTLAPPVHHRDVTKRLRAVQSACDLLWTLHFVCNIVNLPLYIDLDDTLGWLALASTSISVAAAIARIAAGLCASHDYALDDDEDMWEHEWEVLGWRAAALRAPVASSCADVCAPRLWFYASLPSSAKGLLVHCLFAALPAVGYAVTAKASHGVERTSFSVQAAIDTLAVLVGIPFAGAMLCATARSRNESMTHVADPVGIFNERRMSFRSVGRSGTAHGQWDDARRFSYSAAISHGLSQREGDPDLGHAPKADPTADWDVESSLVGRGLEHGPRGDELQQMPSREPSVDEESTAAMDFAHGAQASGRGDLVG